MSSFRRAWTTYLCVIGCGALGLAGCRAQTMAANPVGQPQGPKLLSFESVVQEVMFVSSGDTTLAGQFDWPPSPAHPPLVFIIHHSGAVDRDAYQYLAARLVPAGFAVFRFDKRGNGRSGGEYGCCEDQDALAAYQAAMQQGGLVAQRVFIVAQSVGTEILAQRFGEFEKTYRPDGVVLLSNRLEHDEVLAIRAPIHIIVSDSEPNLAAVGEQAARAHQGRYPYGASFYVAARTEHTLFDISAGPMDWSNSSWPDRFDAEAWRSMLDWLASRRDARPTPWVQ